MPKNDALTQAIQSRKKVPGQQVRMSPNEVQNNAGGFVYEVGPEQRLRRFLILGSEGGTYYVSQKNLTKENLTVLDGMLSKKESGLRAVEIAVEVSQGGFAPKNDQALFVLACAMAAPVPEVRAAAFKALPLVARIPTHLFTFLEYVQPLRGWGKGLQKAVQRWYLNTPVDKLGLHVVKYQQREGWSQRDVIRKAHPKTAEPARNAVLGWVAGKEFDRKVVPAQLEGYLRLTESKDLKASEAVSLIEEFSLPWEVVPDHLRKEPAIWEALLPKMGMTAMIRQLPTMTRVGLLTDKSAASRLVVKRLHDMEALKGARVHPFSVLVANSTYSSGRSLKGSSTWTPVKSIGNALDDAFYLAFGSVTPTGLRIEIALDVSGSMGAWSTIQDSHLTAMQGAAAMALITASVEPDHAIKMFSTTYKDAPIGPDMKLNQVVQKLSGIPFGGTDCSLPMISAQKNQREVDAFIVYTDNETWAGQKHPDQALRDYRKAMGINAKLIVVGMTSTGFTIADPKDPGMLDVVGFDASAPEMISQFMQGRI